MGDPFELQLRSQPLFQRVLGRFCGGAPDPSSDALLR